MAFRSANAWVVAAVLAMGVAGASPVARATDKPNPKRTSIAYCQGKLDCKPKEIVIACAERLW